MCRREVEKSCAGGHLENVTSQKTAATDDDDVTEDGSNRWLRCHGKTKVGEAFLRKLVSSLLASADAGPQNTVRSHTFAGEKKSQHK